MNRRHTVTVATVVTSGYKPSPRQRGCRGLVVNLIHGRATDRQRSPSRALAAEAACQQVEISTNPTASAVCCAPRWATGSQP